MIVRSPKCSQESVKAVQELCTSSLCGKDLWKGRFSAWSKKEELWKDGKSDDEHELTWVKWGECGGDWLV